MSEQDLIELAADCKNRIDKKNELIKDLTKIIFMLYGLIRRGLETSDDAFFEEARSVISEWFDERFDF